jgi:ferredoxin-nitrate reductase
MWAMGYNQSVVGVNKNLSLINLNIITGKIGKPGSGPFSLTGQPNAMGGREVGGLANLLPAHRDLLNADHRNEVERFWKIEEGTIQPKPGLTAVEMFDALASGEMKAVWIICTNPMVSLPDSSAVEKGLKNAKFVVVQDISNKSETLEYADLVLPAAMWAEKEGTMTNSERRITYLNKLSDAPGEALPDTEILCRFAKKMGFKGFDFRNTSDVYDEHAALTGGTNIDISGLNYDILKAKGSVQWPYPKGHTGNGTPRLFTDNLFYTPDKKAKIHTVPDVNTSEPVAPDFPLVLTTGRIRDQWHTMTRTGKVNKLNQHIAENFLEIHPKDAEKRSIKDGDLVHISGRRGEARVKAKVTSDVKRGVVFMPMHWGKTKDSKLSRTNNLTNRLFDPRSKEPDLKFTAVEVVKYAKKVEKIVVIGAGAGAFGFVKNYRELNITDEIHIFSKEKYPFYNRVMLPDYISGEQIWDQLVKMKDDEENELNIKLHRGVFITNIDRVNKVLTTNLGEEVTYDKLILATGSRPTRPKDLPNMDGIFTMRTRDDADNFKNYVPQNGHVVIVGGGLLGLELSASLREIGVNATIIQRISKLMDRQLDSLGSDLLYEEVQERGVDVLFNDEVQLILGKNRVTGVKLKSGRTLQCDALVYSIGTTPNIEIAKDCGLQFNRGVVVNEYLQTSDKDVFAIGEIAEWNRQMWGITAAAEQQSEIVAKFLMGDESAIYKGSLSMNILKMSGIQLCSIGVVDTQGNPEYEEVVFIDKAKRYYKKCIIHKDKLVGTILIGDKSEFAEFKELIQSNVELSDKRLQLLRSGKKGEGVVGKLVCSCNNVGEGNIINKIKSGCEDFKTLCQETGAGTGCGSCRPEVKAIMEKILVAAV